VRPFALAAGVRLEVRTNATAVFANRQADLILLILENLIQNALDVTREGASVSLTGCEEDGRLLLDVRDQGAGLPEGVLARLFTPCASSKPGGSGIGLALSLQLAKHLGAELELRSSTPEGCTFRLSLPCPVAGVSRDRLDPPTKPAQPLRSALR
jgi:signal transduction histidine kinase